MSARSHAKRIAVAQSLIADDVVVLDVAPARRGAHRRWVAVTNKGIMVFSSGLLRHRPRRLVSAVPRGNLFQQLNDLNALRALLELDTDVLSMRASRYRRLLNASGTDIPPAPVLPFAA